MKPEDSAFPEIRSKEVLSETPMMGVYSQGGLTKRELFAAMCLQGLSANSWLLETSIEAKEQGIEPPNIHEIAVRSADTLLAQLSKRAE